MKMTSEVFHTWRQHLQVSPETEALVLAHLQTHPGILLSELLAAYPDLSVDVIAHWQTTWQTLGHLATEAYSRRILACYLTYDPPHPKRTTATPNRGLRWMKREITWKLSNMEMREKLEEGDVFAHFTGDESYQKIGDIMW